MLCFCRVSKAADLDSFHSPRQLFHIITSHDFFFLTLNLFISFPSPDRTIKMHLHCTHISSHLPPFLPSKRVGFCTTACHTSHCLHTHYPTAPISFAFLPSSSFSFCQTIDPTPIHIEDMTILKLFPTSLPGCALIPAPTHTWDKRKSPSSLQGEAAHACQCPAFSLFPLSIRKSSTMAPSLVRQWALSLHPVHPVLLQHFLLSAHMHASHQ